MEKCYQGTQNGGRCTVGRCSEVIYVLKVPNGTSKWWSLQTGGCSLEVVISSGLTVYYYQLLHTRVFIAN
jgi:hypothetical protein